MKVLPLGVLAVALAGQWSPSIPRTWDEEAMRSLEVPLARSDASPKYVSADYYYRIPVRPVYKSYPVHHPAHEPPGYLASLAAEEPQVVFDPIRLRSEQDWIDGGRIVFEAPIEFVSSGQLYAGVRDAKWYDAVL